MPTLTKQICFDGIALKNFRFLQKAGEPMTKGITNQLGIPTAESGIFGVGKERCYRFLLFIGIHWSKH